MINQRTAIIAVLVLILCLALVIAWGTNYYYGQRNLGQERLQPSQLNIKTYERFSWPFTRQEEVLMEQSNLGNPLFTGTELQFDAVDDTYLYLNMEDHSLLANYHFHIQVTLDASLGESQLSVTLVSEHNGNLRHYVSEKIGLITGLNVVQIDLDELNFTRPGKEDEQLVWGKDIPSAQGLRIDLDSEREKTVSYALRDISVASGVTFACSAEELLNRGESTNLEWIRPRQAVRNESEEPGILITHPIGTGSLHYYYSFEPDLIQGTLKTEARAGIPGPEADNIEWQDWITLEEKYDIARINQGGYIQFRFTFDRDQQTRLKPMLRGFTLRYIDSSPPGLSGPLFGTAHLSLFRRESSLERLLQDSSESVWVKQMLSHPDFDRNVDDLIARNINIIGSMNADGRSIEDVVNIISRYRHKILVWQVLSPTDSLGAGYYTDLFTQIKHSNPLALIFPDEVGHDYFQNLASGGLYEFATDAGPVEEILNRGFWWYFVIAIIGLVFVISLGPFIGYNFRFGPKEIMETLAALVVATLVIIPVMLFTGFSGLTLPRDLPQLQIAFGRYVFSSFLQEFLIRAVLILIPVHYMRKLGVSDKVSWWTAISVTSLLFGLTHLGYPGFSAFEVAVFVVITAVAGFILGVLFYRNRSLTAVWIAHLVFNIFLSTMTTIGVRI